MAAQRRTISLSLIVSGVVMALIAGTVLILGAAHERNARHSLTQETKSRILLEARNLAYLSADALLGDYPELVLQPLVQEIQGERPELAHVVVLDHKGSIQAYRDPKQLGQPFRMPGELSVDENPPFLRPGERFLSNPEYLVAVASASHDKEHAVGQAIIALERGYLSAKVTEARQQQIAVLALLLVTSLLAAFFLMRGLLRPIKDLRSGLERIGRGDLSTPLQVRDRTELGLLATTVNDMAAELMVAQEAHVDRERLAHELSLAHNIQLSLLPGDYRGSGKFLVHGAQIPATEVGGDYYDVFELPGNQLGVVVADVSGKGLAGCMATSMLAAYLRAYRESFDSPVDLLLAVERQLVTTLGRGVFLTMFYGIVDQATGRITLASAGHNPTFVYRATTGEVESYNPKGLPLGIVRTGKLPRRENLILTLEPEDVLVQYTDGISEAWDKTGTEEFGLLRVKDVVGRHGSSGGETVLAELQKAVKDWGEGHPRRDDETLLVMTRSARAAEVPENPSISGADPGELELSDLVAAARQCGKGLRIPADISNLHDIESWLRNSTELQVLTRKEANLIRTTLYEVCANIVEHGYPRGTARHIEVYWLPDQGSSPLEKGTATEWEREKQIKRGCFLICDHGAPFDPSDRKKLNWSNASDRTRGRGIGLHLVHAAMNEVKYQPSTEFGNITLMRFDPEKHRMKKEA